MQDCAAALNSLSAGTGLQHIQADLDQLLSYAVMQHSSRAAQVTAGGGVKPPGVHARSASTLFCAANLHLAAIPPF